MSNARYAKAIVAGICAMAVTAPITQVYAKEVISKEAVFAEAKELCSKYNLDVYLIMGQVEKESQFNNDSVSCVGAFGLIQLMSKTSKWTYELMLSNGEIHEPYNPHNWKQNLHIGIYHMYWLIENKMGGRRDGVAYHKALGMYLMGVGGYRDYIRRECRVSTGYSRKIFSLKKKYEHAFRFEVSRGRVGGANSLKEFANRHSHEKERVPIGSKKDDKGRVHEKVSGRHGSQKGPEKESTATAKKSQAGKMGVQKKDLSTRPVLHISTPKATKASKGTRQNGPLILLFCMLWCIAVRIKRI